MREVLRQAATLLMFFAGGVMIAPALMPPPADPLKDYDCMSWYYEGPFPYENRYCTVWLHKNHEFNEDTGRTNGGQLTR